MQSFYTSSDVYNHVLSKEAVTTLSTSARQQESAATVSERVLTAIAARENSDPLDFDRRLYDVIDPDALDALFQSDGMNGWVTFTYLGYEVTVNDDREISLTPTDE